MTTDAEAVALGDSAGGRAVAPDASHDHCLLCGRANPLSLGLKFRAAPGGGVAATFRGNPHIQGYQGLFHGGVLAALLDAAMTHCLFDRGIKAVTGDLRVRYRHPVPADELLAITARVESSFAPLHKVVAEIRGAGRLLVSGTGKFMEMSYTEEDR